MAEDLIGRKLGRYQITALVGQGGMATVYRATHPGLEQTVAVKVLHAHMATDPDMLGRFQQEARAVAALRHPNIVRVVDFDRIDEQYFMVMEYVDGRTLSEHLGDAAAEGRRLPTAEVLRLFEPLCSAVDYAHRQGMIHRDIKPSNVLLTALGEPVLTDYGIAKMVGVGQHTATGTVMGSAYYMSPEQAQGIAVDGRSDIYSLGVMLFESLAGRVPYEGDTLATVLVKHITAPVPAVCPLNAELPPLLDGLMRTALAKDPADRFQTGQALAAALRQGLGPLVAQSGTGAAMATRVERPSRVDPAPQSAASAYSPAPAKPPGDGAPAHDVFISYAASDKAVADAVCSTLEAEHMKCWMAPRDVTPGESYAQALVNAIHAARVFVLVFSSATNQSHQVERELDMAVTSRLPMIPLRVEDVLPRESIEYYLAGHHWLDAFTPPLDDHLRRLSAAIATILRRSAAPAGRPAEEAATTHESEPEPLAPEPEPAPEPEAPAPEPELVVEPAAPEPTPEPEIEAPAPEAVVEEPEPTPDVTTLEPPVPAPELVVEPPAPEAVVEEPEPTPDVTTLEPPAPAPELVVEPPAPEPELVVEPPAPEPAAPEPEPELVVEPPAPEPEPEPDVTTLEPAAPAAAAQAATTYEPPPEPAVVHPAPEPVVEEPEPEPDVTTLEPPAPAGAAQAATTYEPPPPPAPVVEPAVEEPEPDVTALTPPAQAATTYEPPPPPVPAPESAGPEPVFAPVADAGAVMATPSRDEPVREARGRTSRGLHKPTLIAAAAVGIAWIVILVLIDQVVR